MLNPAVARVDQTAKRIVRGTIHPRTTERIANNLGRSFTAVGHRDDVDLCIE